MTENETKKEIYMNKIIFSLLYYYYLLIILFHIILYSCLASCNAKIIYNLINKLQRHFCILIFTNLIWLLESILQMFHEYINSLYKVLYNFALKSKIWTDKAFFRKGSFNRGKDFQVVDLNSNLIRKTFFIILKT